MTVHVCPGGGDGHVCLSAPNSILLTIFVCFRCVFKPWHFTLVRTCRMVAAGTPAVLGDSTGCL